MIRIIIVGVFMFGSFITSQAQNTDKVERDISTSIFTTVSSKKNVNSDKQMPADRSTITTVTRPSSGKQNDAIVPRKQTVKVSPKNIENTTK
jgi:hypothetical protein